MISVIYITYKRPADLCESIQSIRRQGQANYEIIVIDNDPTSAGLPLQDDTIRYFKQSENLGVAGGRNEGIRQARGDIYVFIDDDALVESESLFSKVAETFDQHPEIGCIAFKIINYYTHKILPHEFPHPNTKKHKEQFKVAYFLGGAVAIRKQVFDQTGLFKDLLYWGEELDLAMRMIKAGFEILYHPGIIVQHKANPQGRMTNHKTLYYSFRNRFYVLTPHLPQPYLTVNLLLWSLVWFGKACRNRAMPEFFKALHHGIQEALRVYRTERQPLEGKALRYIKENGGRLWF